MGRSLRAVARQSTFGNVELRLVTQVVTPARAQCDPAFTRLVRRMLKGSVSLLGRAPG